MVWEDLQLSRTQRSQADSPLESAGKYRTAAVTEEGTIFMWEGWSKPLEAAWGAGSRGAGSRLGTAPPPAPPLGTSPGTSANFQVCLCCGTDDPDTEWRWTSCGVTPVPGPSILWIY